MQRLLLLGAHTSISQGISRTIARTFDDYGGNCLALFTGNQRTWSSNATIAQSEVEQFKRECTKYGIDPLRHIVPHGSYLINLGSPEAEKLQKSRQLLSVEISRCEQLGIGLYNFHPGSHLHMLTEDECCERVAQSINLQISNGSRGRVILLLENTAGQGTNIGYKFEHLKTIIDHVSDKSRVGVCLDTCHMFAAGYDLRTDEACERTFADFERTVGFRYLKAMHLNDSKGALGSKKDRHENIGKGMIGLNAFRYIVNDERFRGVPLILETPTSASDGMDTYRQEIALLRSLVGKSESDILQEQNGKEKESSSSSAAAPEATTKTTTATTRHRQAAKSTSESLEDKEQTQVTTARKRTRSSAKLESQEPPTKSRAPR